jgi:PHD/YefM family antitoxin component YafN of YafNO toxin-antitoxin module
MPYDTVDVMRTVNAAELRQSLGRLVRNLERKGEPILLKLGSRPVGVIVSLRDFEERFAFRAAREKRRKLVEEILQDRRPGEIPVQQALDELRGR